MVNLRMLRSGIYTVLPDLSMSVVLNNQSDLLYTSHPNIYMASKLDMTREYYRKWHHPKNHLDKENALEEIKEEEDMQMQTRHTRNRYNEPEYQKDR